MRNIFVIVILLTCILSSCRTQMPITSERFVDDMRKDISFKIATLDTVPNRHGIYFFKCDQYVDLLPDYEVDAEGAVMVYRTTFMQTHALQPANVIWRNIVINKTDKRVLCIDRLLKNGKTFGYIYMFQSETKAYSDESTYHWDVSDHRLMLTVSDIIMFMQDDFSVNTLKTLIK